MMIFEQKFEGYEVVSYLYMWQNRDLFRKNSKCKVFEMEVYLMCLSVRDKLCYWSVKSREVINVRVREGVRSQLMQNFYNFYIE